MNIINLNHLRNKKAGNTPVTAKAEELKTGHVVRKYAKDSK